MCKSSLCGESSSERTSNVPNKTICDLRELWSNIICLNRQQFWTALQEDQGFLQYQYAFVLLYWIPLPVSYSTIRFFLQYQYYSQKYPQNGKTLTIGFVVFGISEFLFGITCTNPCLYAYDLWISVQRWLHVWLKFCVRCCSFFPSVQRVHFVKNVSKIILLFLL